MSLTASDSGPIWTATTNANGLTIPPLNPPKGATAPFVYASNVFTKEQLDSIESMVDMNNGTQFNDWQKKSWTTDIVYNEDSQWLFCQLAKTVHQLNTEYYRFNITQLDEIIQYAIYDVGSEYNWHTDYTSCPTPARKFTIVVQLSDPDEYEGGEFELFPDIKVPQERGLIHIFPPYWHHRVNTVQKGSRKVLITWVWGPPFV